MPSYCVVGGCTSIAEKGENFASSIFCHRLPDRSREPGRYNAWVRFVHLTRSDFVPSINSVICSRHFLISDYANAVQYDNAIKFKMKPPFVRLVSTAVPSANCPKQPNLAPSQAKRAKLSEKRQQKKIVQELLQTEPAPQSESDISDLDFEELDQNIDDLADDPEWLPPGTQADICDVEEFTPYSKSTIKLDCHLAEVNETKVITDTTSILDLLLYCRKCGNSSDDMLIQKVIQGAVMKVKLMCNLCQHRWDWQSRGRTRNDAAVANTLLSGSVLFTGSQQTKIEQYMQANNILFPKKNHFFETQKHLACQVVHKIWRDERANNLEVSKKQDEVHLGGDARCDCMGYSAQFGSYALMDLRTKHILDIQPVSKVATRMNSNAMELEGLQRGMQKLKDEGLNVTSLVTDRHPSITKMMRENSDFSHIDHYFDCWHVSKSISKALVKIRKKDDEDQLDDGHIRSIINRLYYIAGRTQPGPSRKQIMSEKREAMLNHIVGVHTHTKNMIYKNCNHGPITNKTLDPDSETYQRLKTYFNKPMMKTAIQQLSPVGQTMRIESYHRIVLSFAPKHLSFGYQAMYARLLLAAIHYNENCQRLELDDSMGQRKLYVRYLKYQSGKGRAHSIRQPITRNYISHLMKQLFLAARDPSILPTLPVAPPSMTSQLDIEDREVVKRRYRSRFSLSN